jgi:hypothetical protein
MAVTGRIVRTTYRYKRPPRKKAKAAAPQTGPAIVTTTSKKRLKLLRAERRETEPDDPEMVAWIRRAMLGHGPAR